MIKQSMALFTYNTHSHLDAIQIQMPIKSHNKSWLHDDFDFAGISLTTTMNNRINHI